MGPPPPGRPRRHAIADHIARVFRAGPDVVRDPYPLYARVREHGRLTRAPAAEPAPLAAAERDGEVDLMRAPAVPLPALVVAALLGVPQEDWRRFTAWSHDAITFDPEAIRRGLGDSLRPGRVPPRAHRRPPRPARAPGGARAPRAGRADA